MEKINTAYLFIIKTIPDFIKKHCVPLSLLMFMITSILAIYSHEMSGIAGAVTCFGFIFVALKFKLDQSNYNKDLFDRRYEIFLTIDEVLKEWCSEGKSTKDLVGKISGSLIRRSYFLFGEETSRFIAEFRRSIIFTELKEHETDDVEYKREIVLARDFLISVVDGEKLAEKFPELKINNY